jgi:methyl-accepting chemotaxis protein
MTKQNSERAKEARRISKIAESSVDGGVESMMRLSEAINRIKASSDSTARIIKTIDEIAFQTNLLALNAAVEAARAGDAGKGFAVVAEEVRNLAMRSAEAAKNTASLIEESVRNSESGVALNQEVLKDLGEISNHVKEGGRVMAQIAEASEQQSNGVEQVSGVINQMSTVTQEVAATAEEAASGAEELSAQAEDLKSMVHAFRSSGTAADGMGPLPVASRESLASVHGMSHQ